MNKKLIAAAASLLLAFSSMTALAEDFHRTITVSASGSVTAKTDMATLNISVETESPNAKAAARENANVMTDVRQAVISAGADENKLETNNYSLYPVTDYDAKGKAKVKYYKADNSMKVTVNDLSKTGTIMDAAISAGASRVDSVDFSVSKPDLYRDQALKEACLAARHKADIIAASLGRTVTNVISVNESSNRFVPFRMANASLMAKAGGTGAATPVDAGDASVESQVTIVFEIQ